MDESTFTLEYVTTRNSLAAASHTEWTFLQIDIGVLLRIECVCIAKCLYSHTNLHSFSTVAEELRLLVNTNMDVNGFYHTQDIKLIGYSVIEICPVVYHCRHN